MKRHSLMLAMSLVIGVVPAAGAAQTAADSIALDDLRTPASPAFVLLGDAPSAVERPSTPRALAAAFFSRGKDGDLVPDNLAVEFCPYWMVGHPTMTFDGFYKANFGTRILRNLSLSVATEREELEGAATNSNVAFGFRTLLWEGKPSDALTDLESELRTELGKMQVRQLNLDDEMEQIEERLAAGATEGEMAEARRDLKNLMRRIKEVDDSVRAKVLEIQEEDRSRSGWTDKTYRVSGNLEY
jgi:hypothetical protein